MKEMTELKCENARIIELQVITNKKTLKLESENEDFRNENQKYRLKLENFHKELIQNEVFLFFSFVFTVFFQE